MVSGRYRRYRADGSVIWTNQVTYVVTKRAGSIGIPARFAAGLTVDAAEEATAKSAAVGVVKEYLRAFNERDENAWVATCN